MRYCFGQTLNISFGTTADRTTAELERPGSGILTNTDAKEAPVNKPDEGFRPHSISRRLRQLPGLNPGDIS